MNVQLASSFVKSNHTTNIDLFKCNRTETETMLMSMYGNPDAGVWVVSIQSAVIIVIGDKKKFFKIENETECGVIATLYSIYVKVMDESLF